MAFQGWLLKVGDTDISKYVDIENYKVSPEQRAEVLETAYINVKERKALVTYFDVNTGEYKTGEMYVPNYTVETKSWNGMELEYKPLRVAFIEY